MSGERAQKTINVGGTIYDAVILPKDVFSCDGCALRSDSLSCEAVGCMPSERDDGLLAIWKRQVTNTPVEASSQRMRDAEILERMNREHVG
jgi:hypothetical protein